jgi:hypothetical protein
MLDLIKSKKFKVMLFSLVALAASVLADQVELAEAIRAGMGIIIAYLGAQGLSDAFGKGKVEAEHSYDEPKTLPTPELGDK